MFRILLLMIASLLAASNLSGCASMADSASKFAGLGVITEEKSTFDGATIVSLSPTWLYNPDRSLGNSIKLGARWSSNSPDAVALVLAYSSNTSGYGAVYTGITGIDINLDGEIVSFTPGQQTIHSSGGYNTVSKTIYTDSENSVVIPYSMLQRMVSAKDCRLRIHTSKGYEDSQFSVERIPGGQGTAILSIREFMAKVGAVKNSG